MRERRRSKLRLYGKKEKDLFEQFILNQFIQHTDVLASVHHNERG